ncbi:MAG TPA: hypothetical protein VJL80_05070 [Aeromicrobium sp.]|nr:hypothetical protein [Aeromicrobium sp.]HKY57390.1 hypothetical protein [Aeromicrobium sp.]
MADEVPSSKPVKIGGFSMSRRAALGTAVVLLYVAGAAFVVWYSNRTTPTAQQTQVFNQCWDRTTVARGTPCSAEFNSDTLFWAFGIDQGKDDCERSDSYEWADIGYSCEPDGVELRLAIWQTPVWRDQRLVEYGQPESVGRGLLLHGVGTAGESGRLLLRYNSDRALLYASVAADDSEFLNQLIPQVKSRTELLYGEPIAGSSAGPTAGSGPTVGATVGVQ